MKNNKKLVILLVALALLFSLGVLGTMAVLKAQGLQLTNFFSAASVYRLQYVDVVNGSETVLDNDTYYGETGETEHTFTIKEVDVPDKEHFTFLGWADSAAGAENGVVLYTYDGADSTETTVKLTLTTDTYFVTEKKLHAVWKQHSLFRLTYVDESGAAVPEVFEKWDTADSLRVQVAAPVAERENYVFVGWEDRSTEPAVIYRHDDPQANTIILSGETTLYAVWEESIPEAERITYTVQFSANLPTDVTENIVTLPDALSAISTANSHTFGADQIPSTLTVDATTNLQYGLKFAGWSTSAEGFAEDFAEGYKVEYVEADDYVEGDIRTITVTLYAKWERIFYVNYRNTASDPQGLIDVTFTRDTAEPYSINVLRTYRASGEEFTRADHMLTGFSTSNGGSTIETAQIQKPGKGNALDLYACWQTGNFALYFDVNNTGGSGAPYIAPVNSTADRYTFTLTPEFLNAHIPTPGSGSSDAQFLGWAFVDEIEDLEDNTAELAQIDFPYNGGFTEDVTVEIAKSEGFKTLYAIWKYHYVLTYHKGYNDSETAVPATVEIWSPLKEYPIVIDNDDASQPQRPDYTFQRYWSNTLDRVTNEPKYYVPADMESAKSSEQVTLTEAQTKRTIYARYYPNQGFQLKLMRNDPTSTTETVEYNMSGMSAGAWEYPFNLKKKAPKDPPSGYTFVGWSEDPENATWQWLYDDNPSTVIYGGYSDVTHYYLNADISNTKTLYAVWAPDITIKVEVKYNGGSGAYEKVIKTTTGSGCNATSSLDWQNYTTDQCTAKQTKAVGFIDYRDPDKVYSLNDMGGQANDTLLSTTILQLTKTNAHFLGFSTDKYNPEPEYRIGHNLTMEPNNRDPNKTEGAYKSKNGTYKISNITTKIDHSAVENNTYTVTLWAVWKSTVDTYKIVLTDGIKTVEAVSGTAKIQDDGSSEITFAPMTVKIDSSFVKKGWICDFTYTESSEVADYKVADKWINNAAKAMTSSHSNQLKDYTRTWPYQEWYFGEDIHIGPELDVPLTRSVDKGENISITYTLTLYPVWQKGQVFTLKVDSSRGGTLRVLGFTDKGGLFPTNEFEWRTKTSDSVSATARAQEDHYTWTENKAGEFYGHNNSLSSYKFRGYSKDWDGTAEYTVSTRYTNWTHAYVGIDNTTSADTPWDTIKEPVSIYTTDKEHITVTPYAEGIPNTTMTLYAIWDPYKEFNVKFDKNCAALESGNSFGTPSPTTSLSDPKHVNTDVESTDFSTKTVVPPTRCGYKFLGFARTKARADAGVVDYTIANNKLNESLVVDERNADNTEEWTITVNKSSAPQTVTMTLFAVWEKEQEYRVFFHSNLSETSTSGYRYHQNAPLGESTITISAKPTPTMSGYTLAGYSDTPIKVGEATVDDVVYALGEDELYHIPVGKGENLTANTETVQSDGTEITTRTVYAVWVQSRTYFQVAVDNTDENGNSLGGSISPPSKVYVNDPDATTTTIKAGASADWSRSGYRLAGLAYTKDATEEDVICRIDSSDNETLDDIVIDGNDADPTHNVSSSVDKGLTTYTLTLYPVWVKQTTYAVKIDPNGGQIKSSNSSSYSTGTRSLSKPSSSSWIIDADETAITLSGGYFTTYGSEPLRRDGHKFLGFAFDPNATEPDYTIPESSATGTVSNYLRPYGESTNQIRFNTLEVTLEDSESGEVLTRTLTLYAVWQKQQYFRVEFDAAGGTYSNNSTRLSNTMGQMPDIGNAADNTYTFSSVSYSESKDYLAIRPGYKLMGYSYTDWQVEGTHPQIDFTVSVSGSTHTLTSVPVNRDNTDERIQVTTTYTDDGNGVNYATTTLKLYAVWGTELRYSASPGTTSIPSVIRYEPEATSNRVFSIDATLPTCDRFTFMGWATTSSDMPKYGVSANYPTAFNMSLSDTYTMPDNIGYQQLYAVWAYSANLIFDKNCEDAVTNLPENVISYGFRYSGSQWDIPLYGEQGIIPERDGYTFLGWAEKADASEPDYVPLNSDFDNSEGWDTEVTITGSTDGSMVEKRLYAVWAANTEPAEAEETEKVLDKSVPPTDPTVGDNTTLPTEGSDETTPPTGSNETTPPTEGSNDTPAPANIVDAATPPAPVSTEPASTEPVSTEPVAATGTDDETDPPDIPPAPTSGAEDTPDAGGEEV